MNTSTQTKVLPNILVFSQLKYYVFSVVFTSLAVSVPWLSHQFGIAGQIFLPMHFFILAAGFLFGWRTGLLVGIISPIMSYSLTQMPVLALLPQVVIELAVYGLIIGILREKKINLWAALLSAMVLGRLARVLFILLFVSQMNALEFIKMSLPGIILQIILIPVAVYFIQKFLEMKNGQRI
jgi:hypothetical protein